MTTSAACRASTPACFEKSPRADRRDLAREECFT